MAGGLFLSGVLVGGLFVFILMRRRDEKRSLFISFFGHELGGALNGPTLTAKNLMAEVFGPVPSELKPWVKLLVTSLDRFSDRISELGDWARLEYGREMRFDPSEFSVSELIDRPVDDARVAAGKAEIEVRLDRDPAVEKAWGDSIRSRRIVASLLDLALREVRRGSWIALSVKPGGVGVVLEVSFPFEAPEGFEPSSIFERGYLAQVRGEEPLAAGIGLWTLREGARVQGGDLERHGDLTKELRLWFTLRGSRP